MSNLSLNEMDRTQVFFDGPNLLASLKQLGRRLDYKGLRSFIDEHTRLVRMTYFATVRMDDSAPYDDQGQNKLLDFLSYNGYQVIRKQVRQIYDPVTEQTKFRGGTAVDLALAIVDAADSCDHIIIFSGEGELYPAIERAKDRGAKVTVISIGGRGQGSSISDEMRRGCDVFIELKDIPSELWDVQSGGARNEARQVIVEEKRPRRVAAPAR